jgi:predicted RNase H-like HicB family nuclease
MEKHFTMEYRLDDGRYIGRLKEVPGVFSQGETLEDLQENIREAYHLMLEAAPSLPHLQDIPQNEIEITL